MRLILAAVLLAGCAAPRLRPAETSRIAGRTYVVLGASSGSGCGLAEQQGREHARVPLVSCGQTSADKGRMAVKSDREKPDAGSSSDDRQADATGDR